MIMRHQHESRGAECLECCNAYIGYYTQELCIDCRIKSITKDSPYPELSRFILNGASSPKRRKDDYWSSINFEFCK